MAGGSYVAAGLDVLAKTKSRDKVFLRAYSFDAPSVLEALEGACARGAACCLIADASQCSKTNCAAIAVSVQASQNEESEWALVCQDASRGELWLYVILALRDTPPRLCKSIKL
ncbi:hypothetical protein AK812_SmicGene44423 [Symbiodinium microadriaticum]|uniref:Phospholipase D-like domain-containing protein n=1 Tax=Symbiodinium microadriaticum TaxID=2951 RepID=A0A1Q9BYH1_SYMMI|nr:hypothetical protein AK812_SmicGene44423 [Symbiodinium microadriaticum]